MPLIWVGFDAKNSLNLGPVFGKFSLNMGLGFPETDKNSQK